MECPHCGFTQPDGVECVQCHMPLGELAELLQALEVDPPTRNDPAGVVSRPRRGPFTERDPSPPPVPPTPQPAEPNPLAEQVQRVRMTTAPGFSGLVIRGYRGLVSAQVVVHMGTDLATLSASNPVLSLRTTPLGAHIAQALGVLVGDLRLATVKAGGNAVISTTLHHGSAVPGSLLMTLTGTAVEVIRERR